MRKSTKPSISKLNMQKLPEQLKEAERKGLQSLLFEVELNIPELPVVNLRGTKWVSYGWDNQYPNELARMRISPIHGRILATKEQMAFGKGLVYDEDNLLLAQFIANNKKNTGIDLNDVTKRALRDYVTYGGYYLGVKYNRLMQIKGIYHIPFIQMRVAQFSRGMQICGFWHKMDWCRGNNYGPGGNRELFVQPFNPEGPFDLPEQFDQAYYYKDYNDIVYPYPLPDYIGAINYIQTNYELSVFHLTNVKNGFVPSAIISIPVKLEGEAKEEIARDIAEFQSGTRNAGKVMLMFGEPDASGSSTMPQITQFTSSANADIYNETQRIAVEMVLSEHQFSPTLAGISSGSLSIAGNSEEIVNSYELVINNVISKYQHGIECGLKEILTASGIDASSLHLVTEVPTAFRMSQNLMQAQAAGVMTVNEIRDTLGLEAIDETIVSEEPNQQFYDSANIMVNPS